MNGRFLVPNTVTAANIVCGFLSMLAAAAGRFEFAVYLLLAAILLDMSDGVLARKLRATSRFGLELDSFSDSLSFCAAPAFLAQHALLQPLGPFGTVASVTYLLAGVLRLARFNVTSNEHEKAEHTTGVPTPIGAGYVMVLVLMRNEIPAVVSALVIFAVALLMVSRLQLPEWRRGGLVTRAMLLGVANYFAIVIWPNWYTVGWWTLWNIVILIVDRRASSDQPLEPSTS